MQSHKCSPDGRLPSQPDRVIWVKSNQAPSCIQLIEPQGKIRAPYIALSYCWGPVSSSTYLTDVSTLAARKAGIADAELPPLFQDVIKIARILGIDCIWIDRLCIIQGSDWDFSQQAPKMGAVYGNATLTIAAASAVRPPRAAESRRFTDTMLTQTSESDRILVERDAKWGASNLEIGNPNMGKLRFRIRRRSHLLGGERRGGDYGKVSTRARIFQERYVAHL